MKGERVSPAMLCGEGRRYGPCMTTSEMTMFWIAGLDIFTRSSGGRVQQRREERRPSVDDERRRRRWRSKSLDASTF
jgi:hypothetical protein